MAPAAGVFEPVENEPGQKAIIFGPVVAGRSYVVKYKLNLTDPTWTTLTNTTTAANGGWRTVIDREASDAARFYEVEVARP